MSILTENELREAQPHDESALRLERYLKPEYQARLPQPEVRYISPVSAIEMGLVTPTEMRAWFQRSSGINIHTKRMGK